MKYGHIYGELNFKTIFCPSVSCTIQLSTWSGFSRHLKELHNNINNLENESIQQQNEFGIRLDEVTIEPHKFDEVEIVEEITVNLGIKLFTNLLHNFCSSLLASGVNNSTVDFIVKEMSYSFSEVFKLLLNNIVRNVCSFLRDKYVHFIV